MSPPCFQKLHCQSHMAGVEVTGEGGHHSQRQTRSPGCPDPCPSRLGFTTTPQTTSPPRAGETERNSHLPLLQSPCCAQSPRTGLLKHLEAPADLPPSARLRKERADRSLAGPQPPAPSHPQGGGSSSAEIKTRDGQPWQSALDPSTPGPGVPPTQFSADPVCSPLQTPGQQDPRRSVTSRPTEQAQSVCVPGSITSWQNPRRSRHNRSGQRGREQEQ